MNKHLINQIDALLPQTQCTRCGYPSCRKYAEAISKSEAEINQCPPGGDAGIQSLASLLDKPIMPLNPEHGVIRPRQLAVIDEELCIGCTLCIKACPVDAIIGTNKMMHTVIASECTGCDLCLPACPVDCISMVDDPDPIWDEQRRKHAQERFDHRSKRREDEQMAREERLLQQAHLLKNVKRNAEKKSGDNESKVDFITQIMAKAKEQIK